MLRPPAVVCTATPTATTITTLPPYQTHTKAERRRHSPAKMSRQKKKQIILVYIYMLCTKVLIISFMSK